MLMTTLSHLQLLRLVNMQYDIRYEAEETVITNFLQFALDDTEEERQKDMNTIDCYHICIGTFVTENKESLRLFSDTGAPKSVIG